MYVYIYVCICIVAHFGLKALFSSTSVRRCVCTKWFCIRLLCTAMDAISYWCSECQGLKMKEKNGRADGHKLCSATNIYKCFRSSVGYANGQCFKCRKMLLPSDFPGWKVKEERTGGLVLWVPCRTWPTYWTRTGRRCWRQRVGEISWSMPWV